MKGETMEKKNICYLVINDYSYPILGCTGKDILAATQYRDSAVSYLKKEVEQQLEDLFNTQSYDCKQCTMAWYGDNEFEIASEKYEFSDIYKIIEIAYLEDK